MAISLNELNDMHALAQTDLPNRVLAVLAGAEQACTAEEVAAELLGINGRYVRIVSPEIQQVLPAIQHVLDVHVSAGRLRSLIVRHPLRGDLTHYAKASAALGG